MRDYVRLLLGLFTGLYGFYLECWFGLHSCFSLNFFFVSFVLWLVLAFVCVVVLWVGKGKTEEKEYCYYYFSLSLPCVGIVCGEEWGREVFCVWGLCGVCWRACAWGVVCRRPVFGVSCGLLACFLVSAGCLYVFLEKVP